MAVSYQHPNKRTTGALERLNAKLHRAIIDEAHLKPPFCDRRKGSSADGHGGMMLVCCNSDEGDL